MAKILIVDDQKSVLLTLESILTGKGHYVVSAAAAYDAMDLLSKQKFDLLITDAVMPGGKSGFDLVRTLRSGQDHVALPIIMLTGRRDKDDVHHGIEVGVDEYVIKPIDPDILIAKVNSLLSSKGIQKDSFVECQVRRAAGFEDITEIISISEVGMTITSNVIPAIGSKIRIKTDVFAEIGIKAPPLRVTQVSELDPKTQKYTISVHFIGLSETEFKPIRLFISGARRNSVA